MKYRKCRSLWK